MVDLYALLRVSRSATKGEIKAAYRLLALKHHPDVQKGSGDGGQLFRQLTEAYQTLADDSKRRAYDMTLGIKHVRTHTHTHAHNPYNTYNTHYHARPKTKPGPISKEEHKFDYEEWKAWHYGDNAYVQSNIKQNKKGWMHMEENAAHQQYYQRQAASSRRESAMWKNIHNSREEVVKRAQQRREQRRAAMEEGQGSSRCTIS